MNNIIKYEQQKQKLDYLKSLAKVATDSKQYSGMTETSLLNLMLSAQDLGISPMKAINGGFYVVNGKVCMSTSLMADRIRKAGHSIKIVEMTRDKCVIVAVRKDNGDSLKFEYTWEDASLAGLTGSPTWKKFPKLMLYNRCMSSVARILFSDVVGNSYSEEERFDIQGIPAEERPLEDPEEDMIVEVKPEKEDLTEDQCAQIDILLEGDEEGKQKLLSHLQVDSIYDINPKDFDRVIKSIQKRKEKINEQTRVA